MSVRTGFSPASQIVPARLPRIGKITSFFRGPRAPAGPFELLASQMDGWPAEGKAVGGAAMIVRENRVLLRHAFGDIDREQALRARPDSIFRITSATKPVTAAAAMILVDRGKMSLDDPLHSFIPAFAGQRLWNGDLAEPIRIHHLLTHCSGLVDSVPDWFLATDFSLEEIAAFAASQPLAFNPGTRWAYGNQSFHVLGQVIQTIAGMPVHKYIEREILEPLAMKDSFFLPPRGREQRIAAAYRPGPIGFVRDELELFRPGGRFVSPGNGLCSNAPDLARFFQMMLNRGVLDGARILSESSIAAMTANRTGPWDAGFIPGAAYGLGCSVVREPAGMFRHHSAGSFGHGGYYQTHAWADPSRNLISILLCQHRCPQPVSDEVAGFIASSAS